MKYIMNLILKIYKFFTTIIVIVLVGIVFTSIKLFMIRLLMTSGFSIIRVFFSYYRSKSVLIISQSLYFIKYFYLYSKNLLIRIIISCYNYFFIFLLFNLFYKLLYSVYYVLFFFEKNYLSEFRSFNIIKNYFYKISNATFNFSEFLLLIFNILDYYLEIFFSFIKRIFNFFYKFFSFIIIALVIEYFNFLDFYINLICNQIIGKFSVFTSIRIVYNDIVNHIMSSYRNFISIKISYDKEEISKAVEADLRGKVPWGNISLWVPKDKMDSMNIINDAYGRLRLYSIFAQIDKQFENNNVIDDLSFSEDIDERELDEIELSRLKEEFNFEIVSFDNIYNEPIKNKIFYKITNDLQIFEIDLFELALESLEKEFFETLEIEFFNLWNHQDELYYPRSPNPILLEQYDMGQFGKYPNFLKKRAEILEHPYYLLDWSFSSEHSELEYRKNIFTDIFTKKNLEYNLTFKSVPWIEFNDDGFNDDEGSGLITELGEEIDNAHDESTIYDSSLEGDADWTALYKSPFLKDKRKEYKNFIKNFLGNVLEYSLFFFKNIMYFFLFVKCF